MDEGTPETGYSSEELLLRAGYTIAQLTPLARKITSKLTAFQLLDELTAILRRPEIDIARDRAAALAPLIDIARFHIIEMSPDLGPIIDAATPVIIDALRTADSMNRRNDPTFKKAVLGKVDYLEFQIALLESLAYVATEEHHYADTALHELYRTAETQPEAVYHAVDNTLVRASSLSDDGYDKLVGILGQCLLQGVTAERACSTFYSLIDKNFSPHGHTTDLLPLASACAKVSEKTGDSIISIIRTVIDQDGMTEQTMHAVQQLVRDSAALGKYAPVLGDFYAELIGRPEPLARRLGIAGLAGIEPGLLRLGVRPEMLHVSLNKALPVLGQTAREGTANEQQQAIHDLATVAALDSIALESAQKARNQVKQALRTMHLPSGEQVFLSRMLVRAVTGLQPFLASPSAHDRAYAAQCLLTLSSIGQVPVAATMARGVLGAEIERPHPRLDKKTIATIREALQPQQERDR